MITIARVADRVWIYYLAIEIIGNVSLQIYSIVGLHELVDRPAALSDDPGHDDLGVYFGEYDAYSFRFMSNDMASVHIYGSK